MVVEAGHNQCRNCGNGFVSSLVCGSCIQEVPRGSSSCPKCEKHTGGVGIVPRGASPPSVDISIAVSGGGHVPAPPRGGHLALGIPVLPMGLPAPVPESYVQRSFGVSSEVQMGGRDAEILTRMQQAAALLQVLAAEMNGLQGHMPSTREVIKSCRRLALDINEEVEVRLGPQGTRGSY
jgi:hypothetical protein